MFLIIIVTDFQTLDFIESEKMLFIPSPSSWDGGYGVACSDPSVSPSVCVSALCTSFKVLDGL